GGLPPRDRLEYQEWRRAAHAEHDDLAVLESRREPFLPAHLVPDERRDFAPLHRLPVQAGKDGNDEVAVATDGYAALRKQRSEMEEAGLGAAGALVGAGHQARMLRGCLGIGGPLIGVRREIAIHELVHQRPADRDRASLAAGAVERLEYADPIVHEKVQPRVEELRIPVVRGNAPPV